MPGQPRPVARQLPPLVDGLCPWAEVDDHGTARACALPEGHDGWCDLTRTAAPEVSR